MDYVAGLLAVGMLLGILGAILLWTDFCSRLNSYWLGLFLLISPILVTFFFMVSYAVGQQ